MSKTIRGVLTALITPFEHGEVDVKSFKKLLRYQLDRGVDGFVIGGTTAESPTLLRDELTSLFQIAKSEIANQVPIIVGTGTNSTQSTIEQTRLAEQWQADAALVVVPYYNKPPQRGLVAHFRAICAATRIPIILYNVPGRTVASLSIESVAELSQEAHIIGIKEAAGDIGLAERMIAATPESFLMLSGDDSTCLELALAGGDGVISVISHLIPQTMKNLMKKAHQGDVSVHTELQRFSRLLKLTYLESNPIPVKMALFQMGLIRSPELRLPLIQANDELTFELKAELGRLELL